MKHRKSIMLIDKFRFKLDFIIKIWNNFFHFFRLRVLMVESGFLQNLV